MQTALIITPDELKSIIKEAAEEGARKALMSMKPPDTNKRLITVQEAATALRCTDKTIRERIKNGKIRAVRNGRSFLIRESEIKQ